MNNFTFFIAFCICYFLSFDAAVHSPTRGLISLLGSSLGILIIVSDKPTSPELKK
jgi:hypothetical protein